ncbi:unnamed protein product [Prunus armeniaca]
MGWPILAKPWAGRAEGGLGVSKSKFKSYPTLEQAGPKRPNYQVRPNFDPLDLGLLTSACVL